MRWIDDISRGEWLRARLDESYETMHGVVPRGFPAYARIFHPASVRSLPDRAVPTWQEYERMPDAERAALAERYVDEPVSWDDAASAFGTSMHPLAQWQHLVRTPPDGDWRARLAPDGREFTCPNEGEMAPSLLARLAEHLCDHTATPDAGVAAVWEGFGGLLGFYGTTPSRAFLGWGADGTPLGGDAQAGEPGIDPHHEQLLARSFHDPFADGFRKPTWQPGILSQKISLGPKLELPGRAYVLFSAAPTAFADVRWVRDAPWRDLPGEQHGFPPAAQHPNILWPKDRSWVMVSEIDFDSTVVAGSAALVAAICRDPLIEAAAIPAGADLSWHADEINR